MNPDELIPVGVGFLQGFISSTAFILVLFIGFCIVVGFTKLKKTAGGGVPVIKSLDETVSRQPMVYLKPDAPRGPSDQLQAPELLEATARRS
jgi:hypothetical protein